MVYNVMLYECVTYPGVISISSVLEMGQQGDTEVLADIPIFFRGKSLIFQSENCLLPSVHK